MTLKSQVLNKGTYCCILFTILNSKRNISFEKMGGGIATETVFVCVLGGGGSMKC